MHILFLGSSDDQACSSFYADAAEKLGHTVTRFNPEFFKTDGFFQKLQVRLQKAPLNQKVEKVHEQILALCRKTPFDAVLNLAENFISAETLSALKKLPKAPRLLYHSHDNNFSPGILKPPGFFKSLGLYDWVFTTKSQNVRRYQEAGPVNAFYVPSAFEPRVHRPIPSNESKFGDQQFDVTFVGTYDYSRDKYIEVLDWEKLYVWGDRWKKFSGFRDHKNHIVPHAIYHPQFADVLSHSRITLGLLREEAEDRHTQRTFEIPACGSLQISPRNEEILNYFEEDKEIVCFETAEELREKTDYYLKHPEERKRIAQAGFDRVQKDGHTYVDRVKTFLSKIA